MTRIDTLKKYMEKQNLDGILLFNNENRKYISGFTGTMGYVILTKNEKIFATDFRYLEQAKIECDGFVIREINNNYSIFDLLKDLRVKCIGIEEEWVTVDFYNSMIKFIGNIEIIYIQNIIKSLRMIKDKSEIDLITQACNITDNAFLRIMEFIKPGITERQICTEVQYYMKKEGAEKTLDIFIIASGVRSSLPHGRATDKKIEKGDFVTLDIGCSYKGYWSDMTRTVVVGKASDEQRNIYNIVLEAQRRVSEYLRPGVLGTAADSIARNYIREAGYGDNFGHGLGHGVGLEMHEAPRLAQSKLGNIEMRPGMVVTNEPGIYVAKFGGVRIEDVVVITQNGRDILCKSERQLIEIS